MQINERVPTAVAPSDAVSASLAIGNASSRPGLTLIVERTTGMLPLTPIGNGPHARLLRWLNFDPCNRGTKYVLISLYNSAFIVQASLPGASRRS